MSSFNFCEIELKYLLQQVMPMEGMRRGYWCRYL